MVKTTLATKSVTLAVTRLATGYLKEAAAACARLADPGDGEALHDFRVALRRLRSLLRAYRPWLGGALPRKRIRKIGKLARRTGAARDAEVQLAWLRAQQAAVNDSERPGVQWLLDHLNARRDPEYRRLRDELPTAFARLRKRGAARLHGLVEAGLQRAADPRGSRAAGVGEETDGLVRIGYLLHQARQDRTARLLERIEAGEVDRFLDHLHGVCDRLQETAVTP
ncbi:MAG: CHAD domain-containing protein [Xanthomonadaceae bacterium]|nr:CHAD domain-containing protein [Xanthomonadaceae bacterium]